MHKYASLREDKSDKIWDSGYESGYKVGRGEIPPVIGEPKIKELKLKYATENWLIENGYLNEEENVSVWDGKPIMGGYPHPEKIAAALKHGTDPDDKFDPKQLKMGVDVEKEHHDDSVVAKAIAKAHCYEIKDYYTRLNKMEKEAKKKAGVEEGEDEE